MEGRRWPVLLIGFGTLVMLIIISGYESQRRVDQIYSRLVGLYQSHARTEQALRDIESQVYISSILVRDFLLDLSNLNAAAYRDRLLASRSSMERDLEALASPGATADPKLVAALRQEIKPYWASLEPVFAWTPSQKVAFSSGFLRRQVLPRREAVLRIAHEAKQLNAADLRARQQRIDRTVAELRSSGLRTIVVILVVGLSVAAASILRVRWLESRAEQQHRATERAQAELRRLSRQLVRAQEDERRRLSRELHDEVGQTLTALRVELGNVERLRDSSGAEARRHLEEAKTLAAETLRSLRDIATGLRPSVLDDLGVAPAIEWQARDFSRRTGTPVDVVIEGLPAQLPEAHRTCLYRVVQEALTNCARHAQARQIRIALHGDTERLSLSIQDDGRGFSPPQPDAAGSAAEGLGLVGIEERVRELGGVVEIHSQEGKGTLLKVSIPLPKEVLV